ncbi:hypothetical protein [Streptomyces sp. NPDC059398]|uniref:hypothetical protein n=1 Tax=Streptomyces sp. NPDC059398 TaxID=3346820 RepID=UPI00368D1AA9
MNHRYVSAALALASAAALVATASGTSGAASPRTAASTQAASASAGVSWKPCHPPAGYQHFLKLNSAKNVKGKTVVRVTPQKCRVNTRNDEDVDYTATGAARSYSFAPGASVKVLRDTTAHKVTPQWLVTHKLANTPYFSYRLNGRHQITAMEEIYHP